MDQFSQSKLARLYKAPREAHKGQNGRMLVIGGSHLFHAASLWSLTVASRIVDLVHYSSVPENNELVMVAKQEFRNGIVVPRVDIDAYIEEDDVILIGPGMERTEETKVLTDTLLQKYPHKQWVIDAGALQMMDLARIPKKAILTPHGGEFMSLIQRAGERFTLDASIFDTHRVTDVANIALDASRQTKIGAAVQSFARTYDCIVLLKGVMDFAATADEVVTIVGGNSGMAKGGTGDVLSGLIGALACKNPPFLATCAGAYINKQAGDALYEHVGPYFNATDLADEIPRVMHRLLGEAKES